MVFQVGSIRVSLSLFTVILLNIGMDNVFFRTCRRCVNCKGPVSRPCMEKVKIGKKKINCNVGCL